MLAEAEHDLLPTSGEDGASIDDIHDLWIAGSYSVFKYAGWDGGENRLSRDTYAEKEVPDDSTIRQWWKKFLAGRLSLKDEEESDRFFMENTAAFYALDNEKLAQCYNYLDRLGDYVEK